MENVFKEHEQITQVACETIQLPDDNGIDKMPGACVNQLLHSGTRQVFCGITIINILNNLFSALYNSPCIQDSALCFYGETFTRLFICGHADIDADSHSYNFTSISAGAKKYRLSEFEYCKAAQNMLYFT